MAAPKGNQYAKGNPSGRAGAPSTFPYTTEVADRICAKLAEGMGIVEICKAGDMPSTPTVYKWLREHDDFATNYARAREDQADTIFNEIIDISDDGRNDWMRRNDKENPGYEANGEHLQRSRLRVDARKWMAGKLRPKVYGERLETTVSGPGGGPIEYRRVEDMSDDDLAIIVSLGAKRPPALT